jgi:alpha-L-fucosidase
MSIQTAPLSRRHFVGSSLALLAGTKIAGTEEGQTSSILREAAALGTFQPTWESLKSYVCPNWYRDAKFGIWAHWDPQCVPEEGDWYARNMYLEGSRDYEYHVKHYGHPSQFGYKDICNLWKVERWDPDALIQLYKKAGAKYFVSLGNHHDGFDCWNSRHQPWNAVNVGPKKDVVGTWAKTAREQGLRFGVTFHATPGRTWDEFMPVWYGSDQTGPLKGVPYDGNMTKADGQGKWWEGMDPRQLYGTPHVTGTPCPEYVQWFMLRVQDLMDQYHPDLFYFDDAVGIVHDVAPDIKLDAWLGIPDLAAQIAAYYYNSSIKWSGGKLEAVLNLKEVPDPLRQALVEDREMSREDKLRPFPWQTCSCIGEWHYRRNIKYRGADTIVPVLVDNVSKNGNLLLSIPVRGDGTIDDQEISFLHDLTDWMEVNNEAIFGTRPWKIFGEGPTQVGKVSLYIGKPKAFTPEDIRFTKKGDALYAFALGWPDKGMVTIKSLAVNSPHLNGEISQVGLLGSNAALHWTRDTEGLKVTLPENKPCKYAFALKINPLRD